MEPFTTHTGILAALDRANVDTDQIIPKQFLKSIKRTGFGPSLFFDWRYGADGKPDPDFELNHPRFEGRSILVVRNNFGCGSSREHAVWAVAQDGYKVVVAPRVVQKDTTIPGFADIFRNNCVKNGIVTLELSEDEVNQIFELVSSEEKLQATVDLPRQVFTIHSVSGERVFSFEVDPAVKNILLNGLDEIAMTLQHADSISAFEAGYNNQLGVPAA